VAKNKPLEQLQAEIEENKIDITCLLQSYVMGEERREAVVYW
jgi:hypothetical protein